MKQLIRANEIYQQIQSVDASIKNLENDLKKVINDDLDVELNYEIKNKPEKSDIIDEDGSLVVDKPMTDAESIWFYSSDGRPRYISGDPVKNEGEKTNLNPSEFVIIFSALLNYKKQQRKKLVKEFENIGLKLKL